jgi:hypothetical protein
MVHRYDRAGNFVVEKYNLNSGQMIKRWSGQELERAVGDEGQDSGYYASTRRAATAYYEISDNNATETAGDWDGLLAKVCNWFNYLTSSPAEYGVDPLLVEDVEEALVALCSAVDDVAEGDVDALQTVIYENLDLIAAAMGYSNEYGGGDSGTSGDYGTPLSTQAGLDLVVKEVSMNHASTRRATAVPDHFYVKALDLCAFRAYDPEEVGLWDNFPVEVYRNDVGGWSVNALDPNAEMYDEYWAPRSDADAAALYAEYGEKD